MAALPSATIVGHALLREPPYLSRPFCLCTTISPWIVIAALFTSATSVFAENDTSRDHALVAFAARASRSRSLILHAYEINTVTDEGEEFQQTMEQEIRKQHPGRLKQRFTSGEERNAYGAVFLATHGNQLRLQQWRCDSEEEALRMVTEMDLSSGGTYGYTIYDGTRNTVFSSRASDASGTVFPMATLGRNNTELDNVVVLFCRLVYASSSPEAEKFFSLAKCEIAAALNSSPQVVALYNRRALWMDSMREYLPVRLDIGANGVGDIPRIRIECDYTQDSEGGYLPHMIQSTWYLSGGVVWRKEELHIVWASTSDEDAPSSLFDVTLPEGAYVVDGTDRKTHRAIMWNGRPIPVSPLASYSAALTGVQQSQRQAAPDHLSLIVVMNIIASMAMILWCLRRRRRRQLPV